MKLLTVVLILIAPALSLADVHTIQECQLNQGKQPEQVRPAIDKSHEWTKEQGFPELVSITVLWPVWGDDFPQGAFFIERRSASFKNLGEAWHNFFDRDLPDSPQQDIYTCSHMNVMWSDQ